MFDKERIEPPWRRHLHEVIFESDTPAGKRFDVILLVLILFSIFVVMLESVQTISLFYSSVLRTLEWVLTGLFTVEYVLRLISSGRPRRYALSFFGVIDLLSILPTYLSLVLVGSQYLLVIRGLRLLRVFRVLKLSRYLGEAEILRSALRQSVAKITVFIGTMVTVVIIIGATMYLIEGPENGFQDIPTSIYWAVVTLTTVGYGDIAPQTTTGKTVATLVMILGYGIIAVPTGIVSVELSKADRPPPTDTKDTPPPAATADPPPPAVAAAARRVWFDDERMHLELYDGRTVGVPLDWYPALREAAPEARANFRLLGDCRLIHWSGLHLDVLVADVLR
ncbi:MAG: ion transporter [Catalinimonas sp.]